MKKGYFMFLVLFFCSAFLCVKGVSSKPERAFVSGIDITVCHGDKTHFYTLSAEEDLSMILSYLRAANSHFTIQESDLEPSPDLYTFRVRLTDGRHHIYTQLGDHFLRKDNGPWVIIPNKRGKTLKILENSLLSKQDFSAKELYF